MVAMVTKRLGKTKAKKIIKSSSLHYKERKKYKFQRSAAGSFLSTRNCIKSDFHLIVSKFYIYLTLLRHIDNYKKKDSATIRHRLEEKKSSKFQENENTCHDRKARRRRKLPKAKWRNRNKKNLN